MVDRPTGRIAPWMAARLGLPADGLLATADIAERLGLTRQRVSQLQRDDRTFPKSFTQYGAVGLWRVAGIECWIAAHRPARVEAAGRFAGEAGALLLAAEARAVGVGLGWLEAGHFWLAVTEGDAGPSMTAVLGSMGITADGVATHLDSMHGADRTPRRTRRMTPRMQTYLTAADRRAADAGRDRVTATDILLAFTDGKRERDHRSVLRPPDFLLASLERRGLDIAELRHRLVAAEDDPRSVGGLEPRPLKQRPRRGRAPRPPGFDLAPNPLGHDPWGRWPWGAAFARTRDERSLVVDGEQWFFCTDADGFYVRSADGRPVGYRWRIEPKPRLRPVNGFREILPMPPVEVAHWPGGRYTRED